MCFGGCAMPEEPTSIYWDACIFLHYIEGDPTWLSTLDVLLDNASNGRGLVIFTSSISITEVAFAKAEKSGAALDPFVEEAIDAMWNDRSAVKLVEFNEIIAREARTLQRRALVSGRSLKPMDAIHLATAANRRVDQFHTTDLALQKNWDDLGFRVCDPQLLQSRLTP